jgi:hypothetical protein
MLKPQIVRPEEKQIYRQFKDIQHFLKELKGLLSK